MTLAVHRKHAMEAFRGMEVQYHTVLRLTLDCSKTKRDHK